MENTKELYKSRMKAVRDAISWKKPSKTPLFSNVYNWAFFDAGYGLIEATSDYSKTIEAHRQFCKKYNVDLVSGPELRNPFRLVNSLGKNELYVSGGEDTDNINVLATDLIEPDDYDEIAAGNFQKVLWERCLPKRFPGIVEMSAEEIADASKKLIEYNNTKKELTKVIRDEFGMLQFTNQLFFTTMFEQLFSKYRPIRSISMDLRRCPHKVEAACETWTTPLMNKAMELINDGTKGPNINHHRSYYFEQSEF